VPFPVDSTVVDTLASSVAGGVGVWLRTRTKLGRELVECNQRTEELKNKLSALETEMVTLRKLLPGGEWYRKLGLDKPEG
jgi:hypothetical protein